MKAQKPKKTVGVIVDAILASAIGLGIILIYLFFSASLAYGLAMLVGVWFIDAYLKKSFEFPNETLFADLSFAALLFFGGQKGDMSVSLLSNTGNLLPLENKFVPIILGLCVMWLGNLRLCRVLLYPDKYLQSRNQLILIWILSCMIALASLVAALSPQILEVVK